MPDPHHTCPARRADYPQQTMQTPPIPDDEAWAAVMARDRAFDGRFVTGVLTTGIYCRPSCSARHPRRENVRFFADGAAARAAGLRPCLRCSPDDVSRDERAVLTANEAKLAGYHRLAQPYATWRRMSEDKQAEYLESAEAFLATLEPAEVGWARN